MISSDGVSGFKSRCFPPYWDRALNSEGLTLAELVNYSRLTLLNTSVITAYGTYVYKPLTLNEAQTVLHEFRETGKTTQSAIGHQSTADLLSALLEFPVKVNRMEFKQAVDDVGLVFKLKQRAPEGMILSREELEAIGYEFGLLVRTA
jgi:hypothetical protein